MTLVKTQSPDQAKGKVDAVYKAFQEGPGVIPGPLLLLSASPGLFETYTNTFTYWRSHPRLSADLLTCVRYCVSQKHCLDACVAFNSALLSKAGMTEAELKQLAEATETDALQPREVALLAFVVRTVSEPKSITQADVDNLREAGWADSDILDASYHGAVLVSLGILLDAFEK